MTIGVGNQALSLAYLTWLIQYFEELEKLFRAFGNLRKFFAQFIALKLAMALGDLPISFGDSILALELTIALRDSLALGDLPIAFEDLVIVLEVLIKFLYQVIALEDLSIAFEDSIVALAHQTLAFVADILVFKSRPFCSVVRH